MAVYNYAIVVGGTFEIEYEGNSPSVDCPSCLEHYVDSDVITFTGVSVGSGTIYLSDSDTVIAEYTFIVKETSSPDDNLTVASITYDGSTIATLNEGKTATLKCAGMKMKSNLVVAVSELPETPDPVLQKKTVTENGTYTADEGFDGLGSVTVNVKGDMVTTYNGEVEVV